MPSEIILDVGNELMRRDIFEWKIVPDSEPNHTQLVLLRRIVATSTVVCIIAKDTSQERGKIYVLRAEMIGLSHNSMFAHHTTPAAFAKAVASNTRSL